jgi:molybdenum cofactor cytidylyltransferase
VISGIVLAAGTGTRFGGTKQLEVVDGKPLAQHAIDVAGAAGLDEVLVVTGHDAEAVEAALTLPPDGRFVRNPNHRDGQASSLAAAFHEIAEDSEAAVVLMADQPGVTPDVITALIERFRATRKQIVRAAYRNGPGPSLLSREIYAEAGHLHGDVGARILIASHPEWVEDVPIDADMPRDIDVRDDLPDSSVLTYRFRRRSGP